ncbi:Uncharacterized protein Rs2_49194 [Raphanus sativus]|nr:Uncharacterized protein Rs2_49194 [Raphanus sativus]
MNCSIRCWSPHLLLGFPEHQQERRHRANFLNSVFNQVSHSENFKRFTWKNVLNCSGRRQECKLGPILNFPKDSSCYFRSPYDKEGLWVLLPDSNNIWYFQKVSSMDESEAMHTSSSAISLTMKSLGARLRQRTRKLEKKKRLEGEVAEEGVEEEEDDNL